MTRVMWWLFPLLLAAACGSSRRSVWPPVRSEPTTARLPEPPREPGLYSASGALSDVLSGPLQHLGTGAWPGVERLRACAFRNQRVLVVNAYCSLHEQPAFRVEVYSPDRGRVRIYAETRGVVSARQRRDYFTFMVEGSPPPTAAAALPRLSLDMPFAELRRYEQQRYAAYLPSCFTGEQHERPVAGCLGALAAREAEWTAQHHAFLEQPPPDWYEVVRLLRSLALRYGVDPVR